MKKLYLVVCAVCFLSCTGLAQFKSNTQWKCDKPADQHSINIGDKPGHAYARGPDQLHRPPAGDVGGSEEKDRSWDRVYGNQW